MCTSIPCLNNLPFYKFQGIPATHKTQTHTLITLWSHPLNSIEKELKIELKICNINE